MSCLSIRLPPAKKAWKTFTSKLQTRLRKIHKSKAIKQPKNNNNNYNRLLTAISKTTRPSLFLGQRLQLKSRRRRALPFGYQTYYVSKNKAAAPVYIDNIFKEVPVTELVWYIHQQQSEKSDVQREKNMKLIDETAAAAGAEAGTSSKEGEKQGDEKYSSDDMWESRGLASPMLHGIDARAEEFIASFRAEMERQEIMARNL